MGQLVLEGLLREASLELLLLLIEGVLGHGVLLRELRGHARVRLVAELALETDRGRLARKATCALERRELVVEPGVLALELLSGEVPAGTDQAQAILGVCLVRLERQVGEQRVALCGHGVRERSALDVHEPTTGPAEGCRAAVEVANVAVERLVHDGLLGCERLAHLGSEPRARQAGGHLPHERLEERAREARHVASQLLELLGNRRELSGVGRDTTPNARRPALELELLVDQVVARTERARRRRRRCGRSL